MLTEAGVNMEKKNAGDRTELSWWSRILPSRCSFEQEGQELEISHTTIVRRIASGGVLVIRATPISPNSTSLECNVFASSRRDFTELEELKREISLDIDELADRQQNLRWNQSLSSSEFSTSKQDEINGLMKRHLDVEERLGTEIQPAALGQNFSQAGKADDDCK
jgi:hypothetical protein